MEVTERNLSGRVCSVLIWLIVFATVPAVAHAAEVSVHEESGEPHLVKLDFQAAAGENNHLTIT